MADFELAEAFLPVYEVSDAVATVADADREAAWQALLDVDLLKVGREAPIAWRTRGPRDRAGASRQVLATGNRMGACHQPR